MRARERGSGRRTGRHGVGPAAGRHLGRRTRGDQANPVRFKRVQNRTTNPYGRTRSEQNEIRRNLETVEPLLHRGATLELDGTQPVVCLADVVEGLLRPPGRADVLP